MIDVENLKTYRTSTSTDAYKGNLFAVLQGSNKKEGESLYNVMICLLFTLNLY
jgi:hypothetical protein